MHTITNEHYIFVTQHNLVFGSVFAYVVNLLKILDTSVQMSHSGGYKVRKNTITFWSGRGRPFLHPVKSGAAPSCTDCTEN